MFLEGMGNARHDYRYIAKNPVLRISNSQGNLNIGQAAIVMEFHTR